MKRDSFSDKLHNAQTARGTDRALLIAPRLTRMPLPMQRYDDPFLPFGRAVIAATQDLLCAYVFDLAAYLALGAAGAVALERTIASADAETVTILHGPFVGSAYVEAAQAFQVDAVTLIHEADAASYQQAGIGIVMARGWQVVDTATFSLLADSGSLTIFGESALYTSHSDDFAEQIRANLQ